MDEIQQLVKDLRTIQALKSGGGIHIKPENRGKFTETMKRTGKTAEELSHSKNELTRKRAQFALNARKWKHQEGGTIGLFQGKNYYKHSTIQDNSLLYYPYKFRNIIYLPEDETEREEEIIETPEEVTVSNPTPTRKTQNSTKRTYYRPTPQSREQWVRDLYQAYINAGASESLAHTLIAQDAIETAWGKKTVGNYNYGNIHTGSSWKGAVVNANDKDASGNAYRTGFRSYNNMDEYAADKLSLLTRLYGITNNDTPAIVKAKLEGANRNGYRYAEAGQSSLLATTASVARMFQS